MTGALLRWAALLTGLLFAGCSGCEDRSLSSGRPLSLGFFPNITHAQALVGNLEGTFEQAVRATGGGKQLTLRQFNAGPAAMEALLAGAVDVTYVGSGPALTAFVRSEGRIRIIAGASSGGAGLVARTAKSPEDLEGALVAAPQIGNSQDIALRHWLRSHGLFGVDRGGTVRVTAVHNPEILSLFQRGMLDAAWVPEPWVTRLLQEGGGHLLVDERRLWPGGEFPSTVLVATEEALRLRRDEVKALLRAHVALTEEGQQQPRPFQTKVNRGFQRLTGKALPERVVEGAFERLELTLDPMPEALARAAEHAEALGYLPTHDVAGAVDLTLLDEVQKERRPRTGTGGAGGER